MQINNATCKIAYLQVAIGRLALVINGLATNFRHSNNDSISLFWVWTCDTDAQLQFQLIYNTHEKHEM